MKNVYVTFVGKPDGKRPLGRRMHRWEDNINMNFKEIEYGVLAWIRLTHGKAQWRAVVNTVMNFGSYRRRGICIWSLLGGWLVGWLVSQSVY
jgi:hypothetical protein